MSEEDKESKTEEPTGRKLEEAKKKGEVAYTKEVGSTITLVAIASAIYLSGAWMFNSFKEFFHRTLGDLKPWIYGGVPVWEQIYPGLEAVMTVLLVVMVVAFFSGLLGHSLQKGLFPMWEAAMPRMDKLNPVNGAKNLFSLEKLVEFLKAAAKTIGLMLILYLTVEPMMKEIIFVTLKPFQSALEFLGSVFAKVLMYATLFLIVVSIADYWFKWKRNREKLKMSRHEIKDEHKQTDGNPEIRRKVREVQRDRSRRIIDSEVPGATVIVTNPTHFAVAIKYEKGVTHVPKLVAKGADMFAKRIRDVARKHRVPIVENPPLARAIYRDVKVGRSIPRKFYRAVARIIATIFRLDEEKRLRRERALQKGIR